MDNMHSKGKLTLEAFQVESFLPRTFYEIGWPHCSCWNPTLVKFSDLWLDLNAVVSQADRSLCGP